MRHFSRPSPALVISLIALFVALGGTGYAAITIGSKQISNNSVSTKDLKNNSATGKDVKNDKLTGADIRESSLGTVPNASNASTVGGLAPGAFARAPLWVNVDESGSIISQSGGITVQYVPDNDLYLVNFGQDVRNRSISMTRLLTNGDGTAAGTWGVGVCDGTNLSCTGVPSNGETVVAGITSTANTANEPHSFSLLVL
jgi:hypothetical protein